MDRFPTTRWSVVLAAKGSSTAASEEALATLCGIYWYPLYAYIRRRGYSADEAQDLTQGFFARLLEKRYLQDYQRERGRFRSFLLASLEHFLANQRDWSAAQKRGGGLLPVPLDLVLRSGETRYGLHARDELTPEKIFERQWALALLDQTLARLQAEFAAAGRSGQFDRFKAFLTGDGVHVPYSQLAEELAMSEGAVKVAIHRLRRRFREVLREEISQTVADPDEIGDEIRYLMSVLRA